MDYAIESPLGIENRSPNRDDALSSCLLFQIGPGQFPVLPSRSPAAKDREHGDHILCCPDRTMHLTAHLTQSGLNL